jgi:hypothetical protein
MYIDHGRDLDNLFWHTAVTRRDLDTVQILELSKESIDARWKVDYERDDRPIVNFEVGLCRAAGSAYLYPQP